jgi:hypothetical protein
MRMIVECRGFSGESGFKQCRSAWAYRIWYIGVPRYNRMSEHLEDVWLAEVEAEFFSLLKRSRDVGVDVGNQLRAFEHLLERGVDAKWRRIEEAGASDVYVMYARYAMMFFAVSGRRAAIVKWTVVGSEYEQHQARTQACERAARVFPKRVGQ